MKVYNFIFIVSVSTKPVWFGLVRFLLYKIDNEPDIFQSFINGLIEFFYRFDFFSFFYFLDLICWSVCIFSSVP